MKVIGIIGGSTEVSTAEYYKLINLGINKKLGGYHTGEIIINSMDFANSVYFVKNGLWEEGGRYLHSKALSLERAGADFFLCASNTWHIAAPIFTKEIRIPLLHILDPTVAAIKSKGLKKVVLLGTKATMSSPALFQQYASRGVETLVPDAEDQTYIDENILNELSKGVFGAEAQCRYLDIVDQMVLERGAQGVILGCTEIPFLINQNDRPNIPMFDTLRLHVEAAVALALDEQYSEEKILERKCQESVGGLQTSQLER